MEGESRAHRHHGLLRRRPPASTLLTHFDAAVRTLDPIERQSSRPDFGILCYPVITWANSPTKGQEYLLGPNPAADLVRLLSNELHVTPQTPPCFLWHTWEDKVWRSRTPFSSPKPLRKAGVPFAFHCTKKGRMALPWLA
jgi:hypothetical protein